jgi:hypothetical protein
VYGIAHKIMHGVQYIVIVHVYLRHKFDQQATKGGARKAARSPHWLRSLVQPRHFVAFALMCAFYALIFQLISRQPLAEFGFGAISFMSAYDTPIQEHGMQVLTQEASYELYAGLLIYSTQLLHYYVDSFIWKVRDRKVQAAL